jgi:putative transposase
VHAKPLGAWAHRHGVQSAFSRPGTPTDNPFIEAFDAGFREGCVNQHGLMSIEEARLTIDAWREEYNTERPHTALRDQAPAEYKAHLLQTRAIQTTSDSPDRSTNVWVRPTSVVSSMTPSLSNYCRVPVAALQMKKRVYSRSRNYSSCLCSLSRKE